jgi:hypothetical protein
MPVRRARRAVTAHGADAVPRPPASSLGTRCRGTGGVSSSRRRGRRQAQPRGRTLTGWAARRWGRKKKVGAAVLLEPRGEKGRRNRGRRGAWFRSTGGDLTASRPTAARAGGASLFRQRRTGADVKAPVAVKEERRAGARGPAREENGMGEPR